MTQYDDSNRGAIFKNKRKESDKHPDATGQLNAVCPHCGEGTDYWVSAWTKTGKSGERFQSLSVKPKDRNASTPAKAAAGIAEPALDDDIPFS